MAHAVPSVLTNTEWLVPPAIVVTPLISSTGVFCWVVFPRPN